MTEDHNCNDPDQTKNHIEKFGLSVVMIDRTEYLPSFAYSIGLWETYKHPEIICFGLRTQLLHEIINDVAELIKKGEVMSPDVDYDNIFENSRAAFLKVDKRNIRDYFGIAINHYKTRDINALQLIWTDRNDKFPWEEDFEQEFRFVQPLLDRNAAFKFKEEKNLAIFTTRQWLEENEPILRVVHEEDGDWQFLTENIDFENGKVVALEQMVLRDDTLNDVFDLEYGEEAERGAIGDKWRRSKIKNNEEPEI